MLVLLPHHQAGRLTHPEGSRASLWRRGCAPQHRPLAWARFRPRSRTNSMSAPPPKYIPARAVMISGLALDALHPPTLTVWVAPVNAASENHFFVVEAAGISTFVNFSFKFP